MAISLLTNTASLNAQRNYAATQTALSASIGRLSSGMRINSAADDAAGLGISENLQSDLRSLSQAQRNTSDGMSLAQVAEGSLNDMQGIVTRMRELAIESSNGTLGSTERGYVQTEFSALQKEVDRISNVTEFNGTHLLDGTASAGLTFQVGIHASSDNQLSMSIGRTTTSTLGSTSLHIASASLSTVTNALKAIGSFDKAIQQLSQARSKIGAVQNRMSVTLSNLGVAYDNLSAANSSIRDVDVAQETSRLTQEQILSQAGAAVLAQANQLPSTAVSLLRG